MKHLKEKILPMLFQSVIIILMKIPLILLQSVIIILIASTLGFLVNQLRSDGLSILGGWSPEARLTANSGESMVVSLEEAKALCSDKETLFLDARSPDDYARGHIQCALNVPWQVFDEYFERVLDKIPDNAWIVTYCDGEQCSLSEDLAKELISMGYEKVRVLINGWTRWQEAGLPTERG